MKLCLFKVKVTYPSYFLAGGAFLYTVRDIIVPPLSQLLHETQFIGRLKRWSKFYYLTDWSPTSSLIRSCNSRKQFGILAVP
jgi:hypothetical protein